MSMHVVRIRAAETEVLLDQDVMKSMRDAVGAAVFDEIFEDAVFEVTERLSRIETMTRADNYDGVARVAHDLVAVAGTIGLAGVSSIAANLEYACEDGDMVAARAIAGRLVRVGEDSLIAAAEMSVAIGAPAAAP